MMRQPTPIDVAQRWHAAALSDPNTPRHESEPQAGYYKLRRVKNGPWIPVEIYLRQITDPETGELSEPETVEARVLGWDDNAERIWTYCRPITRAEFDEIFERHRTTPAMSEDRKQYDVSASPTLPKGY